MCKARIQMLLKWLWNVKVCLMLGFPALVVFCWRRMVSYVAATMDYTPFPMVIPAETIVGGVTIFILKVTRFEEY